MTSFKEIFLNFEKQDNLEEYLIKELKENDLCSIIFAIDRQKFCSLVEMGKMYWWNKYHHEDEFTDVYWDSCLLEPYLLNNNIWLHQRGSVYILDKYKKLHTDLYDIYEIQRYTGDQLKKEIFPLKIEDVTKIPYTIVSYVNRKYIYEGCFIDIDEENLHTKYFLTAKINLELTKLKDILRIVKDLHFSSSHPKHYFTISNTHPMKNFFVTELSYDNRFYTTPLFQHTPPKSMYDFNKERFEKNTDQSEDSDTE